MICTFFWQDIVSPDISEENLFRAVNASSDDFQFGSWINTMTIQLGAGQQFSFNIIQMMARSSSDSLNSGTSFNRKQ
jgi:hypothetical protein